MTKEKVREIFRYRKDGFLIYKKQPYQSKNRAHQPVGIHHLGRPCVSVNKKRYTLSRLIFLYHHGFLPSQVDHIDMNSKNNRIENLRAATHGQNIMNRSVTSRNKSKTKGVYFCKYTKRWRAEIMANGKRIRIGRYESKKEAGEAYQKAAKQFHGAFARF